MARTEWKIRAITRAMLPILLVLTSIEIGSGLVLDGFQDEMLQSPSLLILVPVTIGTAGNLGSILAARLSTALHLGTLSFRTDDDQLVGNAVATIGLSLSVFPVIGLGAWGLSTITGGANLSVGTVLTVAILSGAVLSVLAVGVTLTVTYASYRLELDPDDVAIPAVTNLCDVLGVVVLRIVVEVIV